MEVFDQLTEYPRFISFVNKKMWCTNFMVGDEILKMLESIDEL